MTSWVDPEDGLGELLALAEAPSAEALHRVLVLCRPVRRSTDTMEPMWLLRRIAENEPEEVFTTAFLLLTDLRWRKGLSQLVRRIADSGCVDEDDLDALAERFIDADEALYWAVPKDWYRGAEFVIGDADGDRADDAVGAEPAEEDGLVHVARQVQPPLRRWAAERLVARDAAAVDAAIERAGAVDARAAAAIMAGLLDAIDHVDAATRDRLIDDAVGWPEHGVRRRGIELTADRDGAEAAYALAAWDSNARIRDWAPTLLAEPAAQVGTPQASDGEDRGRPVSTRRDDQQSLF